MSRLPGQNRYHTIKMAMRHDVALEHNYHEAPFQLEPPDHWYVELHADSYGHRHRAEGGCRSSPGAGWSMRQAMMSCSRSRVSLPASLTVSSSSFARRSFR